MTAGGALLLSERSSKIHVDSEPLELDQVLNNNWILSELALLISAVNIIGGFVVSQRMLNLFRKLRVKDYSWFIVLPRIAISALIVYESEWRERWRQFLVYSMSELTVDVSLE